ncbi:hypothetical protein EMIT0P265_20087 [Pseudomonas zeae]
MLFSILDPPCVLLCSSTHTTTAIVGVYSDLQPSWSFPSSLLVAVLSDYPGEVLLVLFIQILTVYLRVGEVVERLIHQLGKKATLFAAQDAYLDASGQDIGDGLGDLFDQAEGCAGFSVHSAIPFFAPPSMTPPCRRFTRLMPAAMASSDTVNISVTFWLPVWV